MSAGYTKLFSSIVHSTIWQESLETKVVWVTMLALADRDGMVEASVPGLAKASGVSLEACEAALQKFLAPDPYSRSKTKDGRRVTSVTGGWELINHSAYRERQSAEQVREKAAERKRRQRERDRMRDKRDSHGSHDIAEASPEADQIQSVRSDPKDLTRSAREPAQTPATAELARCDPGLSLPDDYLARCEVDYAMPREDALALCRHFAGKWSLGAETKTESAWLKSLWTAVTTAWRDPNERRKLVRPPGLVEHERVQKYADHEAKRLDANARHDQRRWLVDACLDGLFGEGMRAMAEATKTHPNPADEEAAIDELERRYERGKNRKRGRENGPQPAASAIAGALAQPARKAVPR